jgi:histidinol-phosphate aminotransferase
MSGPADPTTLLRLTDAVDPYPMEPSDEELADSLGLPLEAVLRFDMNTLGGGPLPSVQRALREYDPARVVEYGDQAYRALRRALASLTGAAEHRIIPGAGADELIRLATTTVVGLGDAVIVPTPTFPMFSVEARLAGAIVVEVPRASPGERQPPAALRAAAEAHGARLVWICSPNNPTADQYQPDEIAAVADGLPAIVVVDAVYQEFAEASLGAPSEALSLIPLQDQLPNLLVLRSLAKSHGLAGARIGYLVVPEGLAARFDAARLPLAVGRPSEAAALAALAAPEEARERHRLILDEREQVAGRLANAGWTVLPSVTNFLLVRPYGPAAEWATALMARGLVVRSYPGGPLVDWLRITIRASDENARLLAGIEEIAAGRRA